jgi:titin
VDSGCTENTIVGTTSGAGDLISGNAQAGVWISGMGATGNLVEGDLIGTDITGSIALANRVSGVLIANGASSNTIGGTTAGAGNLITDNGGPGVVVGYAAGDTTTDGNQIAANRIFFNTGQAIDLGGDGVTYNSSPRQGPNNLQNFPIIVTTADGRLGGWLGSSAPEETFRIDVFASSAYNADGSGEAEDHLGSMEVGTDGQGQVRFNVPFAAPAGLPIVTATATDPQGNTSEVTALRRATLQAPTQPIRVAPGQPSNLATASGEGIAIRDPEPGRSTRRGD